MAGPGVILEAELTRFNDGSSAGDDKEEGVENGSEAFLLGWLVGSRWNQGACWNMGIQHCGIQGAC